MTHLLTNSRVQVTGEAGFSIIGRIEEIRTIAELPDVPDRATVIPAQKAVLRELGAEKFALISFKTSPDHELMFAAVEIGGEWFDLRKQKLEIETVWVYQ